MEKQSYLFEYDYKKIKEKRLSYKISRAEFCRILATNYGDKGINGKHLSRYENGQITGVPVQRLAAMCSVLKLSIDDIIRINPNAKNPLRIKSFAKKASSSNKVPTTNSSYPADELSLGLEFLKHAKIGANNQQELCLAFPCDFELKYNQEFDI